MADFSITVQNAYDELLDVKKNLNNVTPTKFLRMANKVNAQIYDMAIQILPEDFISQYTFASVAGVNKYALPSDFYNWNTANSGIFKTRSGSDYGLLNIDGQTGAFTVGLTITGATSLATAVIDEVRVTGTSGWLVLEQVNGTFADDETITDTGTGSALINGTLATYSYGRYPLNQLPFGDNGYGFLQRGSYIYLAPTPIDGNDIFVNRYLPRLATMANTGFTDTFVSLPRMTYKYQEAVRDLTIIQYEIFNKDMVGETIAEQRAQHVLSDLMRSMNPAPLIRTFGGR